MRISDWSSDVCSSDLIAVDVVGDEVVVEVRNALPPGPDDRGGAGHSIGLQATRARVQASTGGRGGLESGREGEAFDTERYSQLRGGAGVFQSIPPFVWLANTSGRPSRWAKMGEYVL